MSEFIPTEKAQGIEDFITSVFGDRKATIANAKCMFCKTPNMVFRDEISRREYRISGLCQNCQDKMFGKD